MAKNYVGAATAVAAQTTLSLAKYVCKPKIKSHVFQILITK
jgi:hypothetical protein